MIYKDCIKIWEKGLNKDLTNKFFLNFTYCSNKIRNNETKLRDVEFIFKDKRATGFNGDQKTIKEIENHKEIFDNIFELSQENKSKLSINLIKELHYKLMKDCYSNELLSRGEKPGRFKKGDYVVGLHDEASPLGVEEKLSSLLDEINSIVINEDNALEVVSNLYCYFVQIHPFADGNGLLGRLLINYILLGNNLTPVIIFYNNTDEYYLALDYFNKTRKIDKMIEFLEDEAYKTWIKDYNLKIKSLKEFL
ncbi:Fic family protein [Clostridium estertheticum]|uniref:Fic family protein n=1 Tax=Clostridium estertheticum TaxID=238834 RepID=A0A7Y3WUH1_9CLOT|nr:Fic family protein [Clostridium estertheticum]NNU78166.1 Fic family protein [Clostridium estertheticum]WBL47721.1 Fic family protein [Clostridium estertheticum]